jgi:hypothetical protein
MFPTRALFGDESSSATWPTVYLFNCFDILADVNIDLGPACGERFRLGKPSDYACALSMHVRDALVRYSILNL